MKPGSTDRPSEQRLCSLDLRTSSPGSGRKVETPHPVFLTPSLFAMRMRFLIHNTEYARQYLSIPHLLYALLNDGRIRRSLRQRQGFLLATKSEVVNPPIPHSSKAELRLRLTPSVSTREDGNVRRDCEKVPPRLHRSRKPIVKTQLHFRHRFTPLVMRPRAR